MRTQIALGQALLARDAAGDRERAQAIVDDTAMTARQLGFAHGLADLERLRETLGAVPRVRRARLRREGEAWLVDCDAESARLADTKGVIYLRSLLASPGQNFHVLDLAGTNVRGEAAPPSSRDRAELRERLAELREELAEAVEFNDVGRAAALREEMEELAERLTGEKPARGAPRRGATKDTERVRLNVTRAIHAVVRRIAEECPALGRHLKGSVRTGVVCCYVADPTFPLVWEAPEDRT